MLPENKNNSQYAKYADTGIPLMIKEMERIGALRSRMVAKIAGGASMFSFSGDNSMQIGLRNSEASIKILKEEKIPLLGQDTGEDYGRTMYFYLEDGKVLIKSYKKGKIFL